MIKINGSDKMSVSETATGHHWSLAFYETTNLSRHTIIGNFHINFANSVGRNPENDTSSLTIIGAAIKPIGFNLIYCGSSSILISLY
jgi:hypothetical protein